MLSPSNAYRPSRMQSTIDRISCPPSCASLVATYLQFSVAEKYRIIRRLLWFHFHPALQGRFARSGAPRAGFFGASSRQSLPQGFGPGYRRRSLECRYCIQTAGRSSMDASFSLPESGDTPEPRRRRSFRRWRAAISETARRRKSPSRLSPQKTPGALRSTPCPAR